MATMIPPAPSSDTPGSERRVFEGLKNCADSGDWTILHSLGFSSTWTGGYGEIDFVVIIPRLGIVCVEVKGGQVTHKDGIWYTRRFNSNTSEALKRSPFRQAQEGMWKLRKALIQKFGQGSSESRCPIGWMAILPDVDCPPITPEFSRAEVIDQSDMARDFSKRISGSPSLLQLSGRNDLNAPDAATCKRILAFLRPNFDRVEMASSEMWDTERRIKSLTEEQYAVLDAIAENSSCLVKGPAGTGKTNIAIESARRLSLSGKRVVLACYNRHLGSWLRRCLDEQGLQGVVAGNIHSLLRDRIARSSLAGDLPQSGQIDSEELYDRHYFDLGALAIDELGERFDAVLIDETQDFEAARIADIARAWTGGISDAKTILFGDFTRQALYGRSTTSNEELRSAFSGPPIFNLSINCRNTKRIARHTDLICGFTGMKISDKQPEGDPVEIFYAANQADGIAKLSQIVTALKAAGIRAADVALLGPRRRENSVASRMNSVAGWKIRDISSADPEAVSYSTIHAFKGLESPVVIVVDAGTGNTDETDALLYVAMSRARVRLLLICPEETRAIFNKRMVDGLLAMVGTA
ncbi:NERD domain-containing protein/DEAD/DEAH box helicase [Tardiphaga robiniae]|uniref:NERD domain-containing protein n=1 Tax=Tardiphaga robiniae TaxID=943830 RepID=UPI001586CAE9|nr:NERD domain-containing protein/DEAD/DEAH box helicase [Tardiphaga robiniae]NUU41846.1 NERD domain-containing protein/DEAD/DEAH box helicase [Tardiphaga robiniae]